MKTIAYRSQTGFQLISPLKAKMEAQGKPIEVYSCHPERQRLPMYVNRRGSKHFFTYKSGYTPQGETDKESLTHVLCKQVLADLANRPGGLAVNLELTENTVPLQPIPIVAESAQIEQIIEADGHRYAVDVMLTFRQPEHPDILQSEQCRWNGRIAVEIWHTHRISAADAKARALAQAGLPLIQIRATPGSHLAIDEAQLLEMEDTEREAAYQDHIDKLERTFRRRILGTLLKNPKSPYFAAAQILLERMEQQQSDLQALTAELENERRRNHALAEELNEARSRISAYYAHISALDTNQENPLAEKAFPPDSPAVTSRFTKFRQRWFCRSK